MGDMTSDRWKRVEALYHAALATLAGDRAAFLAEACPGDEALRHDVESLLNETGSDEEFFGGAAHIVAVPPEVVAAHADLTGRTIGGYDVQLLIGVGGMGEVYRARDAKLGRDVAIKILPRSVTRDPDRLARFEREARMLAALNHPNICAIYGLEEADGIRFLVLEFVDGVTLASRLEAGGSGLAIPDALAIARQIAEALETAHEKGIVHRDLKPPNVTITHDGVVKVLDFGLAKPIGTDAVGVNPPHLPTITIGVGPNDGVILGTAAYMSPEQARGKAVDKRTDIWAFGCVLYEMLTGCIAFPGDTVSDTIGKILEREPDWSALPASTPAAIRRLLRRCLVKDPKQRLRDMGDVRIEIDGIDEALAGSDAVVASAAPAGPRAPWLPWLAAGALAIGLAAAVAWNLRRPVAAAAVTRFTIVPPEAPRFAGTHHMVALSPDGAQIAYLSTNRLFVRPLSALGAMAIQGTDAMQSLSEPTFSPDGRSIIFVAIGTLKRISVAGGAIGTICPIANPFGISWGPDGIIVGLGSQGIMRVAPELGSTPETIVSVKAGEAAHGPQMLPDGTHVLFTLATGTTRDRWDNAQIVVQSLKSGDRKTLIKGGSDARYVPTGHIVYAVAGILYAVAFDVERLKVNGDPVPVLEGVSRSALALTGSANFTVSNNGSLAYIPGPLSPSLFQLAVTDRQGVVDVLSPSPGLFLFPRVSPDATRVAYGTDDGKEANVYTRNLSSDGATRRVSFGGKNRFPVWTSQSQRFAFQSDRGGDLAIWQAINDTGKAERLTTPEPGESHEPQSWSPASDTLLYSVGKGSDVSLWTYSFKTRKAAPFGEVHSSNFTATDAMFSPDGRWVAYDSNEGGKWTIDVQPFPATGAKHQVFAKGQDDPHHPLWSLDGKELFYVARPGGFASVRVAQPFSLGDPQDVPWWGGPSTRPFYLGPPSSRRGFDMMADGRFLGVILGAGGQTGAGPAPHIQVVLNWFEELKAITGRGSTVR